MGFVNEANRLTAQKGREMGLILPIRRIGNLFKDLRSLIIAHMHREGLDSALEIVDGVSDE